MKMLCIRTMSVVPEDDVFDKQLLFFFLFWVLQCLVFFGFAVPMLRQRVRKFSFKNESQTQTEQNRKAKQKQKQNILLNKHCITLSFLQKLI